MSFSVDLVNLLLYCTQQLGVMLGVGSETIVVILFFLAMRNGEIEPKEEQFGRAVHRVLRWGLGIMIASGVVITTMHLMNGAVDIVYSPAFILKWILIALVVAAEFWRGGKVFGRIGQEAIIAATWYALFILHILAPIAVWIDLLVLWAIWSAGFVLCFMAVAHAMHIHNIPGVKKPEPKPQPKPEPKVEPKKVFVAPPEPKPIPKPVPPPAPKPISPPPAPKPVPPPPPVVVVPVPPPPPPVKHAPLPVVAAANLPMVEAKAAPAPHKPEPVPMAVPKKPAQPVAPAPKKPLDQMPIPTKPKDPNAPKDYPDMPAIRVMPKTQEDVDKQIHQSTVQS